MTASPHVGRNVDVNWHLPYLIRHWVGTKEKARLGQWDFTKKEVIFSLWCFGTDIFILIYDQQEAHYKALSQNLTYGPN